MMNELISVIVPIYNVEKFLKKSLTSLINQTYKNIQIILINDGSSDESGKICDAFARKDSRFEVYHIENKGVSNARNLGLKYSKGKYIFFMDPDDWIEKFTLEILIKKIQEKNVDLVECSYSKVYLDNKKNIVHNSKVISKKIAINSFLMWKGYITSFCWDKLYKREIIGNLKFKNDLKIGEDSLFVFEYLLKCKKIAVINNILYNYFIRNDSALGNFYTCKKIDAVKSANYVFNICKEKKIMLNAAEIHVGLVAFFTYGNLLDTIPYKDYSLYKRDIKYYKKNMKKCTFSLLIKNVHIKILVLYKVMQYMPLIYISSKNLRKRKR